MKKDDIYKQGEIWESTIIHDIKNQRNLYLKGTIIFAILAIISMGFNIAMFPLKTIEAVAIVVDKSTGHVEVTHNVENTLLETTYIAVKKNLLTQFIIWYKTYDNNDINERSNKIKMFANNEVFNEYLGLFKEDNNSNPNEYYQTNEKAVVEIISIQILNKTTYQIRYQLNETLNNKIKVNIRKFSALVKFSTTNQTMKDTEMWINPLGLVVESIRFDEEYKINK